MSFFKHERALVHPEAKIGKDTRIWANANVQEGASIGDHCNICDGCYVERGVVVGNDVTVKNGVALFEGVTLEDDVFVGANAVFINDRNPRSHRTDAWVLEKTLVQKGATLGANATIMCGVTIGSYAVVGAGAVVLHDVGAHHIVVGNPARKIGYACRCGQRLIEPLKCSCGLAYQIIDNQIRVL
ncbi:MAG: N-acetyltransferase [Candidatus Omnitrophica bacterium]|nr:N-acetyltransferase [Candidatus Omnitrophota bacterium]